MVWGGVGVLLFLMITGFFLIDKDISCVSVRKIFSQVLFYGFSLLLLYLLLVIAKVKTFDKLFTLRLLFPLTNGAWWFPLSYVCLIIMSPVINYFVKQLSNIKFFGFLIFFGVVWYFGGEVIDAPFARLQSAIFGYLLGGFIKKLEINKSKISNISLLFFALFSFTILGIISFFYFKYKFTGQRLLVSYLFYFCIFLFKVLFSFVLFVIFIKKDFISKKINVIASSTFAVYLIHENFFTEQLINKFMGLEKYLESGNILVYCLVTALFILFICFTIDNLRIKIFGKLIGKTS